MTLLECGRPSKNNETHIDGVPIREARRKISPRAKSQHVEGNDRHSPLRPSFVIRASSFSVECQSIQRAHTRRVFSPCSINFQNSLVSPNWASSDTGSLLRKRKSRSVFL